MGISIFRVGALFADALLFLVGLVVWPRSRPNPSLYRSRLSAASLHRFEQRMPCILARRHLARR